MNGFWRATPARRTIRIVVLVWGFVYLAALTGPIHGVSIIPDAYRARIVSISKEVFGLLVLVWVVVEWVRGRPPWAPFLEAYRRKKRADPEAKP